MDEDIKVIGIQPGELDTWWPIAEPLLHRAIYEFSDLTASSVYADLIAQRSALFIALDNNIPIAAGVTEVIEAPALKKVDIVLIGGSELNRWIGFIDSIANWYKQSGCQVIELRSRPGFVKLLKPYGFSPTLVTLRRKL